MSFSDRPTAPPEPRALAQRRAAALLARREVPLQPRAQPVEPGEQHPFGDVRLIELVANLPLELRREEHATPQIGIPLEPLVQAGGYVRHEREQRVLVDD